MKKLALNLLLPLIMTASLQADIKFDLHAQHFSTALAGNYEGARYELPTAFASTNLSYVDGRYTTADDNGYFNVALKTPALNWGVTLDVSCYLYKEERSVKVTSDSGDSVMVTFDKDDIRFNGQTVLTDLDFAERITVGFVKNGNDIEVSINGNLVGATTRPNFGKLKYAEVQLITENDYSSSTLHHDDLHSLTVGSR